jgi:hypothetical protein
MDAPEGTAAAAAIVDRRKIRREQAVVADFMARTPRGLVV